METRDKQKIDSGSSAKMLKFRPCRLPGCFLIDFPHLRDDRGCFVKTFQWSAFEALGLDCNFTESFYTESGENVLRGMHFQSPPVHHAKLVYCISGAIYDVALDLRVGSPTYGEHEAYDLTAEHNNAVYLPPGIAHGFSVQAAPALVVYEVTSEHSPEHDRGVHWDSFGASWPLNAPTTSDRDKNLPPFEQLQSPFRFDPATFAQWKFQK